MEHKHMKHAHDHPPSTKSMRRPIWKDLRASGDARHNIEGM